MRTLLEEQFSREDHHLSEESEEELSNEKDDSVDEVEDINIEMNESKSDEHNSDENDRQCNSNNETSVEPLARRHARELATHCTAGTPSALSSGYGSQPLTSTPASSED
ncbi:unnamed protein product, partial [Medioppia subpectinata]